MKTSPVFRIATPALLTLFLFTGCGSSNGPGSSGNPDGGTSVGGDGSGGGGGGGADAAFVGCGDGVVSVDEACDDSNAMGGDGCSADCTEIEAGWVCPTPGMPCVTDHTCGNGLLEDTEGCDDHNTTGGDGCAADCSATEPGWTCPVPGLGCSAAQCGDGIVAGFEECDDGTGGSPGCSATCQVQGGWACPDPGQACHETTCGDGVTEGTEECDDQNNDLGDGCDPLCHREPVCADGTCQAVCGDGAIQAGEGCDDGNLHNGDGCSSTCQVEDGFECPPVIDQQPDTIEVPVVYRDFIRYKDNSGNLLPGGHPDFENHNGDDRGMLETTLGADGKPVYAGDPTTSTTSGQANWDEWYRDTAGVNKTYAETLTLNKTAPGTYVFDNSSFFPLDGRGWVASGDEPTYNNHNFGFTSELRYWFQYQGGEVLSFRGDDDVWVFINRTMAIDLGGVHSAESASITLDGTAATNLNLTIGGIYEVVVLQAERHTSASSYKLTLEGFDTAHSQCHSTCGDGVTTPDEVCDDGVNNGGYGSCTADCLDFGPRCGDGMVQPDSEQCDDGVNAGGYGGCMPTCQLAPYCGDGVVQHQYETCDDGNDDPGDGCDHCQQIVD